MYVWLVGVGVVFIGAMVLNALRLDHKFWVVVWIFACIAACVYVWNRTDAARVRAVKQLDERLRCVACGGCGDVHEYEASLDDYRDFLKAPSQLCADCRYDYERWVDLKNALGSKAYQYGYLHSDYAEAEDLDDDTIEDAERVWGTRAHDMLAMLLIGVESARHLLTNEAFAEAKPWLDAHDSDDSETNCES